MYVYTVDGVVQNVFWFKKVIHKMVNPNSYAVDLFAIVFNRYIKYNGQIFFSF